MTHTSFHGLSVVVCAKNEETRIALCLASLQGQGAHEVIVVDGASTDCTAEIARRLGARVVVSTAGSLAADRQIGAEFASGTLIAFIDADHRLPLFALGNLANELDLLGVDVVQASLGIVPRSFWNRAESDFLAITHNGRGVVTMAGTAPAVFRAEVLEAVPFATHGVIDDTDWMYRLHRDTDYRVGIGSTVVMQEHEPRLRDYLAKWTWYGRGDGEFMRLHPERRRSMLFHLLIRYPLLHSARAIAARRPRAVPYAIAQGLTRFAASLRH